MASIGRLVILIGCLAMYCGCSDNGNNGNGTTSKGISQQYFPVQDGNFWSYNNNDIRRELSGDTTINGVTCARLLENGETAEAWTIDKDQFAQHMLDRFVWFDPPLAIPLDLEPEDVYDVRSEAFLIGDTVAIGSYTGTLTFEGYVSQEVNDYSYDSCAVFYYRVDQLDYADSSVTRLRFREYYARGVGMVLSPGYLYLDYAVIDGDTIPETYGSE